MASVIIKNYLLKDTVDSTALAVFNANPGGWSSAAQVPTYLYTSLCTLWTGSSGNVAALNKALVVNDGQGLKPSKNCIVIDNIASESADASGAEDFILDDIKGSENSEVHILYQTQNAPPANKFNTIQNSMLRVRLLLDNQLRKQCQRPGSIPINNTGDLSIDASVDLCMLQWRGTATDYSSLETLDIFVASYVRCFGKTTIPA